MDWQILASLLSSWRCQPAQMNGSRYSLKKEICWDRCGAYNWKECCIPLSASSNSEENPKCFFLYNWIRWIVAERIHCWCTAQKNKISPLSKRSPYPTDPWLHVAKWGIRPSLSFVMHEIGTGCVSSEVWFVCIHAVSRRQWKRGFLLCLRRWIQSTSWHLLALARVGCAVDKRLLMARRSPWNWV